MTDRFFAIVAGSGPGTGRACALKFAKQYTVVLLARRCETYDPIVEEIRQAGGQAIGVSTDFRDVESVTKSFETIKKELGDAKLAAAIYNVAGGWVRKPFLELTQKEFEDGFELNSRGLFFFAQQALPLLLASVEISRCPPSLLITGATASIKGSANFASFATGKSASRALGQCLAREFGPRGIHVAHVIVDGTSDIPMTDAWVANNGVEDGKISPDAIADGFWDLHTQPRSTFTWELDMTAQRSTTTSSRPPFNYPLDDEYYALTPRATPMAAQHSSGSTNSTWSHSSAASAQRSTTMSSRPVFNYPLGDEYYALLHRSTTMSSRPVFNYPLDDEYYALLHRSTPMAAQHSSGSTDRNWAQSSAAPNDKSDKDSDKSQYCSHPDCLDANGRPTRYFPRKADVTRHHNSTHEKQFIDCPHPRCTRKGENGFTRMDHLKEHQRGYHGEPISKRKNSYDVNSRHAY